MCEYTSTKKRHIHILVQSEKIWADSIFCVGSARIFFDSIVRWKWSFFSLNTHCLSVRYHVFIRALRKVTEHHFFFSTHLIFGFYTHFVLRCLWQNRRWRKNIFFVFIIIMCDEILATFWKLFFFLFKIFFEQVAD